MKHKGACLFILMAVLVFPLISSAAVPQTINYQGYLTDSGGTAVSSTVSMTFSLYTASTGGIALWTETQPSVAVTNGVYSVSLGSVTPLNIAFDTQYYLGVTIGADPEMSPRQVLTSTPYALRAAAVDSVADTALSSNVVTLNSAQTLTGLKTFNPSTGTVPFAVGPGKTGTVALLSSDYVDGLHASSFLRIDGAANQTVTGSKTFSSPIVGSITGNAATATTATSVTTGSITPDKLADTCAVGEVFVKTASGWVCGTPGFVVCSQGDFISCYRGPAGTLNVGPCRAGMKTCLQTGTGYDSCQGEILPAVETCDNIDNNCDGIVDNAPGAEIWYVDNDGDGFGNPATGQVSCSPIAGRVNNNRDCNDNLSSVFQTTGMSQIRVVGGSEICGDSVDNDCNGQTDEQGCSPAACNADEIAAFNGCLQQCLWNDFCMGSCIQGVGFSVECDMSITNTAMCLTSNQCMNGSYVVYDCANQGCRQQWETAFGAFPPACTNGEARACGSNVGECSQGTQTCTNGQWGACVGSVGPVAEICGDGKDNDCNGTIDDTRDWFRDADNDGFGDPNTSLNQCAQPQGYADNRDDCDDTNPAITNQGCHYICGDAFCDLANGENFWNCAQDCGEICDDGIDNDGDGSTDCADADCSAAPSCLDSDADGYPDAVDCGPFAASVHPGAAEVCDGIDNNCDGQVDEGCGPADGTLCNDGNVCTTGETYLLGVCQGGTPVSCDDSNQCTSDSCNPASGCQHSFVSIGTVCTGGTCDGSGTCILSPSDGTLCNDGNVCTTGETYLLGVCQGGTPVSCDDSNECTSDSCNPASGCQHSFVSIGAVCTGGTCDGSGTCIPSPSDGTLCNDGNVCTTGETYLLGVCQGGTPVSCDDANACTTDSCDAGTGCLYSFVLPGTPCPGGACDAGGNCVAEPTCSDQQKNGTETDVDCGGGFCAPCADGKFCNIAGDCASGSCSNNVCVPLIGSSPLNPGITCMDIHAAIPGAGDGIYWINPDGSGPAPPFQAYCDMTTDGGGWTLWASMTQSGMSSSGLIQLSSDNYMESGRFGFLRIASSQFMARGQSTGTRFYLSMGEAVSGNCNNLSSSTPEVVGDSFPVYGHKETSGCNTLGGDAAYLSITSSMPNLHVVSTSSVGHWHLGSSSGAVLNLDSNTTEARVELYLR